MKILYYSVTYNSTFQQFMDKWFFEFDMVTELEVSAAYLIGWLVTT